MKTKLALKTWLAGIISLIFVFVVASYSYAATITATVNNDAWGSLTPSGTITVPDGSDQEFIIKDSLVETAGIYSGYYIDYVLIDGKRIGAVEDYTFTNITEGEHTIEVFFGDLDEVFPADHPDVSIRGTKKVEIVDNGTNSNYDDLRGIMGSSYQPPPGTTIMIAPGIYTNQGRWSFYYKAGTAEEPVTIRGLYAGNPLHIDSDGGPSKPPLFQVTTGSGNGGDVWVYRGCAYLFIGNIVIKDAGTESEVNAGFVVSVGSGGKTRTDVLSSVHHIVAENIRIERVGKLGQADDGIKSSSVDYLTIRRFYVRGWQESGFDMNPTQHTIVEDCYFIADDSGWSFVGGYTQPFIQMKGASRDVLIHRNFFYDNTGGSQAMTQVGGGVTGSRDPMGTILEDGTFLDYAAKDVEIAGNRYVRIGQSRRPVITWNTSNGGYFHHNTIAFQGVAAGSIFLAALSRSAWERNQPVQMPHDGMSTDNLIVFNNIDAQQIMSLYSETRQVDPYDPRDGYGFPMDTFIFDTNAWYDLDNTTDPDATRTKIENGLSPYSITETNGIYGINPMLDPPESSTMRITSTNPVFYANGNPDGRLRVGADAYGNLPIAENDEKLTTEGAGLITIDVLVNDSDPNDILLDETTVAIVRNPGNGTAEAKVDGTVDYTPEPDFVGIDTFYYRIQNIEGLSSNLAKVTVTVSNVNDQPVAVADTYSTAENQILIVDAAPADLGNIVMPGGSQWKYLDDGTDQGTAWRQPGFNDSGWSEGPAKLGYGESDIVTEVSFGPDSGDKHITTYFRRWTDVNYLQELDNDLLLRLVRDDGGAVYINDQEVHRVNLTANAGYDTLASDAGGELQWHEFPKDTSIFTEGPNLIAVEMHQTGPSSSDLGFDLEFTATRTVPLSRRGVLCNDFDADGDGLTATLIMGPAKDPGFTLNSDGTFTYTPEPGFNGSDSFTYQASDGLLDSNIITVTITVGESPDTPGDVNDDGEVTITDAILVAQSVIGLGSVDLGAADVDGSGTVTLKDAMLIAQYVNEVIAEF